MQPKVTIVTVFVKSTKWVEKMVESLEKVKIPYELRVVENTEEPYLTYSEANNLACQDITTPYILLLNDDTEAINDFLTPMVEAIETVPNAGIVGAKLFFPDGTIQHAGVTYGVSKKTNSFMFGHVGRGKIDRNQYNLLTTNGLVTFACALIRTDLWNYLEGLDEDYANCFEDVDFCIRAIECAWDCVYQPKAQLIHHESVSRDTTETTRKANIVLYAKHGDLLETLRQQAIEGHNIWN